MTWRNSNAFNRILKQELPKCLPQDCHRNASMTWHLQDLHARMSWKASRQDLHQILWQGLKYYFQGTFPMTCGEFPRRRGFGIIWRKNATPHSGDNRDARACVDVLDTRYSMHIYSKNAGRHGRDNVFLGGGEPAQWKGVWAFRNRRCLQNFRVKCRMPESPARRGNPCWCQIYICIYIK